MKRNWNWLWNFIFERLLDNRRLFNVCHSTIKTLKIFSQGKFRLEQKPSSSRLELFNLRTNTVKINLLLHDPSPAIAFAFLFLFQFVEKLF